ncbi:FAD-dependent oxidoreductase [Halococcus sp. AFM35]|uniref:FAD-dependent oxidoreductase n=1 Tax=Halococcus sp. AFM35 TaxID=3421653 RepID=UPI003EBCA5FE
MNRATDVLVVGGGATGTGIARDLALRGVDVTLCERGGLAAGTTGRSHGVLHSGARYADFDAAGARECIAENRILKHIAGACIDDTGGLFVQLESDDPEYFDEKLAACREQDIDATVLTGDEAREAVPALAADTERVIRVPDAVIYPSRLVAATAASARDHGARILPNTPVNDLLCEDGAVVGARVDGADSGEIRAEHVVNATGAWAERLAALAGIDVAMRPTSGVMVAIDYDGIEPVLNRCRPPSDGDIVVPHGSQVVLGTTSVEVDDPDDYDTDREEIDRMVNECAAMVPGLDGREVSRAYWGVRPLYAPDEAERSESRSVSRGFFLLDHARDGIDGFTSIVGGKLTTHRRMAEAVADHVCEELGVAGACRTDEERLPGHDDPAVLDELVAEFEAGSPADSDVTDANP